MKILFLVLLISVIAEAARRAERRASSKQTA